MELSTQPFSIHHPEEEGRIIRGVVTRPRASPGPIPGVLILHGFKGFLRWGFFPDLQQRVARSGRAAVAFNLSGSGVGEDLESFTEDDAFFRATPSRALEDLDLVRAFLDAEDLGIDVGRLSIFGHSLGGGAALVHAARRGDYRAVVTWAAVSTSLRFGPEAIARWREEGVIEIPNARTGKIHRIGTGWLDDIEQNADALDIPAACSRLGTPTLLVHGSDDEAVSIEEGRKLDAAFQPGVARFVEVPGAGHTFGAVHPYQGPTAELELAFGATLEHLRKEG
ncbi:MAG TPA: alpha/beta fold hydrolase [Planctomycetes bacterium]|nr:alpha/beta fold hydrolase [Planctomycetota bacterium]